jgi:hypothetical protein
MHEKPKLAQKNIQSQPQEETEIITDAESTRGVEDGDIKQDNTLPQVKSDNLILKHKMELPSKRPKLGQIAKDYTERKHKIQADNEDEVKENIRKPQIKRKRKLKFEDKYHRLTTFLENDLYDMVMDMKESGEIDSILQIINDSVKQYLKLS